MMRQKEVKKITEEARELIANTHQLVNGDLEIAVNTGNYTYLGELAEDINQISLTFNNYINEISHILSHLSAGNMAVSFTKEIKFHGDFLPIRNALHKIRHALNSSFEEINELTTEVDKLCSRVEEGAGRIAQNSSRESLLINDLTDTIYRITEQTQNNALHAKAVSESVMTIQKEAMTGSSYMEQMLSSIREVKASSDDISHIVSIINEISNQTKLIALNAAIEAARAGDSGSGFRVVANEVGILAERSRDAVKQTTQLISKSIDTAQASVKIANKTSESFGKIQSSIDQVSQLCTDIAEVSKIQADNLKNTSVIITDISKMVQNNAAYAQENCTGASDLAGMSAHLKTVMTRFRLKNQAPAKTENKEESKIAPNLQAELFKKLENALSCGEVDKILEDVIRQQEDFECMYVIDSKGFQFSHTVMNPEIVIEQDDNFKPAMPGDNHETKKYFRKAMKKPEEWYTSYEYISTATGGLCRTLSCSYNNKNNETLIMCIDLICRY